jgi:hypothetical protein
VCGTRVEIGALHLLGRSSPTEPCPQLFSVLVIYEIGSCFMPVSAWKPDLLDLNFPHSWDDRLKSLAPAGIKFLFFCFVLW